MASPTPTPSDASRIYFLDLPTEIKAYIVRLARLQDLAYSERRAYIYGAPYKTSMDAWIAHSGGWQGRSCNALFMVNKELSGLCARHLFEVAILALLRFLFVSLR
jgi:hypothetical protein